MRAKFLWVFAIFVIVIAGAVCYVRFIRIPANVAYVSEEDGGIVSIDLKTLKVLKRVHPKDTAPRGIGLTFDGKYLVTANKDTADASVLDTRGLRLVRKIAVGDNPEFVKFNPSGTDVFISYEPGSTAAFTCGAESGAGAGPAVGEKILLSSRATDSLASGLARDS